MLYHLLKSTLHPKANACSIGTFITFYMQSSLYSKANACNIGTFIRSYIQMRVQIKNKAFAYRFYRPFTQQCILKENCSLCTQFTGKLWSSPFFRRHPRPVSIFRSVGIPIYHKGRSGVNFCFNPLLDTLLKYQFWKNVTSEKWNSDTLNTFGHFLSSLLGVIATVFSNHAQKWRQKVSKSVQRPRVSLFRSDILSKLVL